MPCSISVPSKNIEDYSCSFQAVVAGVVAGSWRSLLLLLLQSEFAPAQSLQLLTLLLLALVDSRRSCPINAQVGTCRCWGPAKKQRPTKLMTATRPPASTRLHDISKLDPRQAHPFKACSLSKLIARRWSMIDDPGIPKACKQCRSPWQRVSVSCCCRSCLQIAEDCVRWRENRQIDDELEHSKDWRLRLILPSWLLTSFSSLPLRLRPPLLLPIPPTLPIHHTFIIIA